MGNKPITIRNTKVTKEDFIMEEKHLDLDIMIDLKELTYCCERVKKKIILKTYFLVIV